MIVTSNYGEAGALDLFGRALPPVATADVTFRYWRPAVTGRQALLVGFEPPPPWLCTRYRVVMHFHASVHNDEQGAPIARCVLAEPLASLWPRLVATYPG